MLSYFHDLKNKEKKGKKYTLAILNCATEYI